MKTASELIFSSHVHTPDVVGGASLTAIQNSWRQAVSDCRSEPAQHLVYRISLAKVPAELWVLLGDIYQCVAQLHTESMAVLRINELVKLFEGWVSDGRIAKI